MDKVLGIVGGKGGVGKTTTSINLAYCLKDTTSIVLVDGNLDNPHIGLHLGKHNPEYSIHTYITTQHNIQKAVYDIYGIKVVLGNINKKVNYEDLHKPLLSLYDFGEKIILDSSDDNCLQVLKHCEECIIVSSNDPVSVAEAYKTKTHAKKMGVTVLGIVLNRMVNKSHRLSKQKIAQHLELPILAVIPEDEQVMKALSKKQPVVHYNPRAKSSQGFIKLAQVFEH